MKNLNSVSEFVNNYDAFILDIWGVIHDGENAYPGVVETMRKLHAANKKIIFLSNAPRRAFKVKKVLAKFGITEDLYDDTTSSGEAAYQHFANDYLGKKYFYIGPPKDADLLHGLDYDEVFNAKDADFAIATGFDEDNSTLDEKLPQIKDALVNKLKLYCVNPDLIVVRQNGTKMLCAGVIGNYYKEQGGEVEFIGKPHKSIYDHVFETYLYDTPKSKICAIGDGLETDIKGANNAGIDSVLILGGILQAEKEPLDVLMKKYKAKPTATLPKFNWQ